MKAITKSEAQGMLKDVGGPFSAKVQSFDGRSFTKHTAVSREKMVRADIFHEWNEFGKIEMRNFGSRQKVTANPCFKCGGSGRIDRFASIESGVCFQCNGTGCSKKAA